MKIKKNCIEEGNTSSPTRQSIGREWQMERKESFRGDKDDITHTEHIKYLLFLSSLFIFFYILFYFILFHSYVLCAVRFRVFYVTAGIP